MEFHLGLTPTCEMRAIPYKPQGWQTNSRGFRLRLFLRRDKEANRKVSVTTGMHEKNIWEPR